MKVYEEEGTVIAGKRGDLEGVIVLTMRNSGGVLSATFYSPGLESSKHICKIVPESEQIFEYQDLLAAVVRAGFVAET